MSELARVLRPGALLVVTFPYRTQFEDEFVGHDLYGTPSKASHLLLPPLSDIAVQKGSVASGAFDAVEQVLWRKEGVPQAQACAHKIFRGGWPRRATSSLRPMLPLLGRIRCRTCASGRWTTPRRTTCSGFARSPLSYGLVIASATEVHFCVCSPKRCTRTAMCG